MRGACSRSATSYTDVYDHFGLLGPRSIFGHCIHLDEEERGAALGRAGSIAAFCPTSNLFLGTGLFDLAALCDPAQASASASRPTSAAAPAIRCSGPRPRPTRCCSCAARTCPRSMRFYLMTLGNARALGLEMRSALSSRQRGRSRRARSARDAGHGAPLEDRRRRPRGEPVRADDMGDDRAVRATYILGQPVSSA